MTDTAEIEWVSSKTDESRDQQADLSGSLWAMVGPDSRQRPDGWYWSILDFDENNDEVAGTFADTEDAAKTAVATWIHAAD